MNEIDNKILAGVSFGIIYIAFIIVSFLVIVTKKHPFFIKHKLKLGAIILSLNSIFIVKAEEESMIMCYEIQMINDISINQNHLKDDVILIKDDEGINIEGVINSRESKSFSYVIVSENNEKSVIIKGVIEAKNGRFNKYTESFIIKTDEMLSPGKYELLLFDRSLDELTDYKYPSRSYKLEIK